MQTEKVTAGIYTLGCKVNQYESQAIAEEFEAAGVTVLPPEQVCDIYVINTCTVTSESDRKARQTVRRAIAANPYAYIVVTGCLAQVSPESMSAISGVDAVCGNTSKLSVVRTALSLVKGGTKNPSPSLEVNDLQSAGFEKMKITRFDRTRAYIKIEDGCENKCTYCIIPSARGGVRSKPADDVIAEVKNLCSGEDACREVVLTGIETASYGRDLGDIDLGGLLCLVDRIDGIGRVRLGSLDPSLITDKFVSQISGLHSLAPHFHLSLQSGSDRILALMKRKYNSDMAMCAIERLRAAIPNVKFTTDIIVGFPGETDEDFRRTVDFAKRAEFLKIHIFPYSKRRGTPAAQMPGQIPENIKHERLKLLSELEKEIRDRMLAREVTDAPIREVLFESCENGFVYGHTDNFIEVAAKSAAPLHSQIRTVRLTASDENLCYGDIVSDDKSDKI